MRFIFIGAFFLFFAVTFFMTGVSSQAVGKTDSQLDTKDSPKAVINAKGVGFPRISFNDGEDLPPTS